MKKTRIYLAGVVVLGLAYAWLKTMMSEPVFFAGAIGYLLLLRLVVERFGR
jgi:hypothetical protein